MWIVHSQVKMSLRLTRGRLIHFWDIILLFQVSLKHGPTARINRWIVEIYLMDSADRSCLCTYRISRFVCAGSRLLGWQTGAVDALGRQAAAYLLVLPQSVLKAIGTSVPLTSGFAFGWMNTDLSVLWFVYDQGQQSSAQERNGTSSQSSSIKSHISLFRAHKNSHLRKHVISNGTRHRNVLCSAVPATCLWSKPHM